TVRDWRRKPGTYYCVLSPCSAGLHGADRVMPCPRARVLAGTTRSADSCARMRVSNRRGAAYRQQGGLVGKWSITVLLGSALVLTSASAMRAAELQVIAGGGIAAALNAPTELVRRASGHHAGHGYRTW